MKLRNGLDRKGEQHDRVVQTFRVWKISLLLCLRTLPSHLQPVITKLPVVLGQSPANGDVLL